MSKNQQGPEARINDAITNDPLRVVTETGEMLGVISRKEALDKAAEVGLDLVEVSPQADPPVCKFLDYGKFRYEAQKKAKEAKKKQKIVHIKEIKLRLNIGDHDYQTKMKAARKFIEAEDKVKFSLRFRGREMAHNDLGFALFNKVVEEMQDITKVEQPPKMEGKQLVLIVAPL